MFFAGRARVLRYWCYMCTYSVGMRVCALRISHLSSGPGNPRDIQEVWDSADLGSLTFLVGLGILGTSRKSGTLRT